jgi:CRISPR-associated endonuclease Csn1
MKRNDVDEPNVVREGAYVLGIRLGVASLGWAALSLDAEGQSSALLAVGARKFPVGAYGDIERGRETGPNERRQGARAVRVRLVRRVARLRDVWHLLQSAGLLPPVRFKARDSILKELDARNVRHPYVLRAKALDGPLAPYELGRAIYHLAQRRGYQSNRRADAKDRALAEMDKAKAKELGVVKQGIADLAEAIQKDGARTIGEHFARKHAHEPIRRRWTARSMYREEFDKIIMVQRAHHVGLTENYTRKLAEALFSQRPLKSQSHRIGRCDLEPARHRAALGSLSAQEFRVLCRVNDLRLMDDVGAVPIELSSAQRAALLEFLQNGDATFPAVRKVLGLSKSVRFNAERIDDEKLIGFRTSGKLRTAVGPTAWAALSAEQQAGLVEDLLTIDDDDALSRRLARVYGFEAAAIEKLRSVVLEPGYAALSSKAINRILPRLRSGVAYATARKEFYPDAGDYAEVALLPRLEEMYKNLPNPLVRRAIAELRVVVNALIKKHGRPRTIRVSLMRELRVGRKARESAWTKMLTRAKERSKAAERMLVDLGVQEPAPWMIDKMLLAEECGWVCPYTGKSISIRALFGDGAAFETAHIVPFYQSLDDSFANKTLCHVSVVNTLRSVEPLAHRQVDEKVLERFSKFKDLSVPGRKKGKGAFHTPAKEKLRRAKLTLEEIVEEYDGEVIAGRFVDSCYASKLAVDMLSRLYPSSRVAVSAVRGAITGYIREGSGLNRIDLPPGSFRRATVDAIAVALAGPTAVRQLSAAAKAALPGRRRLNPDGVVPWPRFVEETRDAVTSAIVSARVRRKITGALHEETFYRHEGESNGRPVYSVRKHLWQLTPTDVPLIAGSVRFVVEAQLVKLKQEDPRKAFAKQEDLPRWRGSVIRRVRITRRDTLFAIRKGPHRCFVAVERNHHAAVFMRPGARGGKALADQAIVSQFEAQRRHVAGEPVVQIPETACAPCPGFRTLSGTETVDCTSTGEGLQTVRSISPGHPIAMTRLDDGRKLTVIEVTKSWLRRSVEQLRLKGARKITITPLGEVRRDGT